MDRSEEYDRSSRSGGDRIVGLDVGGRLFYTNLSTLTNASAYFEARFNGKLDPGASYRDERGRDVYFLDRSYKLFEYLLDFLREGLPTWPSSEKDPVLWRRLLAEADYFGIDLLSSRDYRCYPECDDGGRGVLHWLGTARGKNDEYRNPCTTGEVKIIGVFDKDGICTLHSEHHCLFVEHRPPTTANLVSKAASPKCMVLWCKQARRHDPSIVTFKSVTVRPTHYSLRYGGCNGMNVWNFEGSVDGSTWTTLHKARNDPYLLRTRPSDAERDRLRERIRVEDDEGRKERIMTEWAERHCRHTWELDPVPSVFYRHFRFIGVGEDEWSHEAMHSCMHAIGFEVFGDVREAIPSVSY